MSEHPIDIEAGCIRRIIRPIARLRRRIAGVCRASGAAWLIAVCPLLVAAVCVPMANSSLAAATPNDPNEASTESGEQPAAEVDPQILMERAVDYWRGQSSYTLAEMHVHRPDWQRSMKMKSWTEGRDRSLVRFVEPAKDAGNATLTRDEEVWTFSPKSDRVIKIPASMKAQSWMGSDFSYQDLSKDDEILDQYQHRLIGKEVHEAKPVYIIESIPKPDAAVVWGKEIIKVRSDNLILEHEFYDQDGALVKRSVTSEIALLGGKLFPKRFRMSKAESPDEWTEVTNLEVKFGESFPGDFFGTTNLRSQTR